MKPRVANATFGSIFLNDSANLARYLTALLIACGPLGVSRLQTAFEPTGFTLIGAEPKYCSILGLYKSRASSWLNIFTTE
jgi:hypothetical protein